MSNYIAKAFVVKQGSLVKTFIELVSQHGYRCGNGSISGVDDLIYIDKGNIVTVSSEQLKKENFKFDKDTINCNHYTNSEEDAIELFLELAKLTDDKKYIGQWRIKSKDIFQLTEANITSHWCINSKVLTPIKLAENWKQIKESNGRYLQKIRG